jgi:hypothetical protein
MLSADLVTSIVGNVTFAPAGNLPQVHLRHDHVDDHIAVRDPSRQAFTPQSKPRLVSADAVGGTDVKR